MRAKFVNEFERGLDPKQALGIGRVAKIRNFFRDLEILDDWYEITPNEVIFDGTLDLQNENINWLPDNLKVKSSLYLKNTPIRELPNGLQILGGLNLSNTSITELPDDLQVGSWLDLTGTQITEIPDGVKIGLYIWVNLNQKELIDFMENSQFAEKIKIDR